MAGKAFVGTNEPLLPLAQCATDESRGPLLSSQCSSSTIHAATHSPFSTLISRTHHAHVENQKQSEDECTCVRAELRRRSMDQRRASSASKKPSMKRAKKRRAPIPCALHEKTPHREELERQGSEGQSDSMMMMRRGRANSECSDAVAIIAAARVQRHPPPVSLLNAECSQHVGNIDGAAVSLWIDRFDDRSQAIHERRRCMRDDSDAKMRRQQRGGRSGKRGAAEAAYEDAARSGAD